MKILYFRLKGYAGIYHGMGLDSIEIDFSKFQNRNIILIRGENGCGKSTILNALSLNIDKTDDYRVDMYYNPTESDRVDVIPFSAEKEIIFSSGPDMYRALIQSPVSNEKRKKTQAFISKNGEELNPTGNVSSYKDIRDDILVMDPNYINLSFISSENRGIVDQTPAERKTFMSTVMDSTEFYNSCYKTFAKKSSTYRSIINNMKSKIFNIGDPEDLKARINYHKNRLSELDNAIVSINHQIANCKATIEILDPDNKIQELYHSIIDSLGSINSRLNKYQQESDTLYKKFTGSYKNDVLEEKKNLENSIVYVAGLVEKDKNDLSHLLNERDSITSRISDIETKIVSLQSEAIQDGIVQLVEDTEEKISLYESTFSGIGLDTSITKSELLQANEVCENLKNIISQIYAFPASCIESAIESVTNNDSIGNRQRDMESCIQNEKERLNQTRQKISELEGQLKEQDILKSRPTDCTIDTCPFIARALEYRSNNLEETLDRLHELKDTIEVSIISYEKDLEELSEIRKCADIIHIAMTLISQNHYILDKIPLIRDVLTNLHDALSRHHIFNEFCSIPEYLGMIDLVDEWKKESNQLIQYKADLKIYLNNKTMLESLSNDLEPLKEKLVQVNEQIKDTTSNMKFNENVCIGLKADLEIMNQLVQVTASLKELKEEKKQLGDKFNQVKNDIASVKEKVDSLSILNQQLESIHAEYNPLKTQLDQMLFSEVQLQSYSRDLDEMMVKYEKNEFLKDACSPTKSGIQTILMNIYMANTIKIANELLQYLFEGGLTLGQPQITSNEFQIPFIESTNGLMIPDISYGSTSQKCMFGMIISFALLSQGSEMYNVIRLDEIDGGLDNHNSNQFTQVLRSLMQLMNIEQCIMISHKLEIESSNAGIINVTKNGLSFIY